MIETRRNYLHATPGFAMEMADQTGASNTCPALTTNEGSFVMAPAPCARNAGEFQPDSAADLKQAVMAAFENGEIDAAEAEDWIVLNGLAGA